MGGYDCPDAKMFFMSVKLRYFVMRSDLNVFFLLLHCVLSTSLHSLIGCSGLNG